MNTLLNSIKISILILLFLPVGVLASSGNTAEAEVLKVVEQREITRENGSKVVQQNLELGILDGVFKGQTKIYQGISDLDVLSSKEYKIGDRVIVSYNRDESGEYSFYVTDYIRLRSLTWLLLLFIVVIVLVGGRKALMALLSLGISFFIILKILVPLVFAGYNPLVVGLFISFLILFTLIYLTEGWNRKAHISIISIAFSLLVTAILSLIFASISRLSGTSQEEVIFLIDAIKQPVNFSHLLLAAIVIGTLGVLDDVVVGQVETVSQIKKANPNLKDKEVFKMAMSVGRAHLGAIINTLFLAYVGASLPLILLFNLQQEPFLTFSQTLNHEDIATEIVRTLVGVIGLCLSAPIATILASKYLKNK